jgi:hypothetical protein
MRCLAALLSACVLQAEARADVFPGPHSARPFPPAPPVQPLAAPRGRVILEGITNVGNSRLRFPVTVQAQLRADAGQGYPRRLPLFTAGTAIGLALALAGLWVVRSGRARGMRLAAMVVLCGVTAGLVGCWIDKRPPAQERPAQPITTQADNSLSGEALLEISDSDSEITLTLDRDVLQRFLTTASTPAPTPKRSHLLIPERPTCAPSAFRFSSPCSAPLPRQPTRLSMGRRQPRP